MALIAGYFYLTSGLNQPQSALPQQETTPVLWVLSGAVTSESVSIKSKLSEPARTVELMLSADGGAEYPTVWEPENHIAAENIYQFNPSGLSPNTSYSYVLRVDGVIDDAKAGEFQTFGEEAQSFRFAMGSCASSGSNGVVFDTIRGKDPLFFLMPGDLHYEDLEDTDIGLYHAAYDMTFTQPAQAALYRAAPLVYIWDDHDYGDNNSDSTSIGRSAVRLAYQEAIPHYSLPEGSGDVPIYQSFEIGRVRFILTDLRSEKDVADAADNAQKSMMGSNQKAWFKQELLSGKSQNQLIFWVSSVPWNGPAVAGEDHWAGYTTEREEIANFIAGNEINHLVILSGDAHMLAFDDGSNSNFATVAGHTGSDVKGMPIFHAAALDRPGSTKGGAFSHGLFPGWGQFGLVDVNDLGGDQIEVTFTGLNYLSEEILSHTMQFDLND